MITAAELLRIIDIHGQVAEMGLDQAGVMKLVTQTTLELVAADGAVIEIAEGDSLSYRAASGTAVAQLGVKVALKASLSGACMRSTEALICTDSEQDPRVDRAACRRVGLRSMVVVPLMHVGQPVGVLKAMSREVGHFGPKQAELLTLLARVVGTAMYWATHYGQDDLFQRATHDDLTGLANRAMFLEQLRGALQRSRRTQQSLAVLMLDMDGLKPLNDHHGHSVGDAALVEFARRLKDTARGEDVVARLGGDEFALLMPSVSDANGVRQFELRLQEALRQPFVFRGQHHPVRASCGFAMHPADGARAEQLIDCADQRMYESKRERKKALADVPADQPGA